VALADGKPWTDPLVVKETPGSGALAPRQEAARARLRHLRWWQWRWVG
jgi:hypothetical protein